MKPWISSAPSYVGVLTILTYVGLAADYAAAQTGYLCIVEKATGFTRDKGTNNWSSTDFKVEDSRYLLLKKSESETEYEFKEFGKSEYKVMCSKNLDSVKCDSALGNVSINLSSLRFQLYHPYGYVHSDPIKERRNESLYLTPYLGIGRCSKF
jgi:hypothetical protein